MLASCSNQFSKVLKSKDYEYKLKKADEYFGKKKYKNAEELYVELFPVFKGTENLKNCIINMHIVLSIKKIMQMLKIFSKDF